MEMTNEDYNPIDFVGEDMRYIYYIRTAYLEEQYAKNQCTGSSFLPLNLIIPVCSPNRFFRLKPLLEFSSPRNPPLSTSSHLQSMALDCDAVNYSYIFPTKQVLECTVLI